MPPVGGANNEPPRKQIIPLNGKLLLSDNATEIGTNYQTLKNMRYTDTHPKSVPGMTRINSAGATGSNVYCDSMFHFSKSQPSETHLLAHIRNDGTSSSKLMQNKTAIPSAGEFEAAAVYTDASKCTRPCMSDAPGGQMVYCNGLDNFIWAGDEMPISAFYTTTGVTENTLSGTKDYTAKLQNTLQDANNVVTISATYDSYVSVYPLLQGSTCVKSTTVAAGGNNEAYMSTDASRSLTGADDTHAWLSVSGTVTNQRFHIDLGTATIVTKVYYENFHDAGANTDVGVQNFTLWGSNTDASFAETTYATDTGWTELTCSQNTFDQHAASDAVDPKYITVTNTTAYRYYAFKFADNYTDATYMGVRRIELQASGTQNFVIGSTRPLQGVKFYVKTANSSTSTIGAYEWTGSAWSALSVTDNTSVTGKTLAQTGTVTWDSTVSTSKAKYLNGTYLFFYRFYISAGSAVLYYVTLDAPFQPLRDLWDGTERSIVRCYFYDYSLSTKWKNYTSNIIDSDSYLSSDATTFVQLSDFDDIYSDYYYFGFTERMSCINFTIATGTGNTSAATIEISYWNGTSWTALTVSDTTSIAWISMYKTGSVSWTPPDSSSEFTTTLGIDDAPLYYYRVKFSADITVSTHLMYVSGIPAQMDIKAYKFPIMALDSLFLCCEVNGKKNTLIQSVTSSPQVFNSQYAYEIEFGDDKELTGGCVLYSQFGASLYNLVMIFKANESWALIKNADNTWTRYIIDSGVGLAAHDTLRTTTLPLETATGLNRNLAIWQGTNGIYVSDGRSPIPIHKDIVSIFDQNSAEHINLAMIDRSIGFIDPAWQEYHWCFATGSSTVLNKELVFDLRRWKWYEVSRTASKYLQQAADVCDTDDNHYIYGFADTNGFVQRLEYGNTFDGVSIVSDMRFGEFPLGNDLIETFVDDIALTMVAKATTTNDVAGTHYVDGLSTGTTYTFDPTSTGSRSYITRVISPATEEVAGIYHSLDLSMTTDNETVGFEPLHLCISYIPIRNPERNIV